MVHVDHLDNHASPYIPLTGSGYKPLRSALVKKVPLPLSTSDAKTGSASSGQYLQMSILSVAPTQTQTASANINPASMIQVLME